MAPSSIKTTKVTTTAKTVRETKLPGRRRIENMRKTIAIIKDLTLRNYWSLLIIIGHKFYSIWLTLLSASSIVLFILCLIQFDGCDGASLTPYSNLEYDTVMEWTHVVDLNEDFRVHWTINNHQDITFELHVRALGYVGFGFSIDGTTNGADLAVGWVDDGHTFFQDRYTDRKGSIEPHIDPSQDYILIKGYENATHTLLRFRRKLDTCDYDYDLTINNDTMRIIYMYHDEDPARGVTTLSPLPNLQEAWRPYKPLILLQKPFNNHVESIFMSSSSVASPDRILELRNRDVELPYGDDSLVWCKLFKLDALPRKHHIIQYMPLFDSSWSYHYLQQITLYECPSNSVHAVADLEYNLRGLGQMCSMGARSLPVGCNAIVAAWTRGSDGFTFPSEAGYPLEGKRVKYFMMETHYSNLHATFEPYQMHRMTDSSGLRVIFTPNVRPHDAGVLSIGIEPNWRHIIPPGQKRVLSQGHCMEDCTGATFPSEGINIFAVMMRTHQIGRQITLRQIRQNEELYPIANDHNVDSTYQEFRRLNHLVRSLPGDRLIAECIYDSSSRKAITLGGLTMKEEACTALTYYYPRQKQLTTCHSLPSLPTVLHSLGIEQLAMNSNPVVISSPPELAGMTLEARLLSYDWENQFNKFQEATLHGTFKPICSGAHNQPVPITDHFMGHRRNITKRYKEVKRCKPKRLSVTELIPQLELPVLHDIANNHIADTSVADNNVNVEGSVRSSRSSFIETLALSGSESSLLLYNKHHSNHLHRHHHHYIYYQYYDYLTRIFGFHLINMIPLVWWWWLLPLWLIS